MKRLTVLAILTTFALLIGCNKTTNQGIDPKSEISEQPSIVQGDTNRNENSNEQNIINDVEEIEIDVSSASEEERESTNESDALTKAIYLQAMEKWKTLGGNYDFKDIKNIDTSTLVKIYSSYIKNKGENPSGDSEYWMTLDGFDRFVEDYFGLSPEQFHNNYQGAYPDNYDAEKGFRFYSRTSILPDNAKYELLNYGKNDDQTLYLEIEVKFELPVELVPEGESSVTRRINVTFKYADQTVHFLKASYEQDGEAL